MHAFIMSARKGHFFCPELGAAADAAFTSYHREDTERQPSGPDDLAMHWLLELHNVGRLISEADRFSGGNGLVTGVGEFARSILKFSSISVCEVFGYLIASAIGVRVPRMRAVWTREAVSTNGVDADPGRIGILVEHHEDWTALSRDAAARLDPSQ